VIQDLRAQLTAALEKKSERPISGSLLQVVY
jgi:hypothetical protein